MAVEQQRVISFPDELSKDQVIRLYSSKLAEATLDPVWLANELCGEGLLDTLTRDDLLTTVGVSAFNKALQLWRRIEVIVKFHENPDQALLTVCNVMKQRTELAPLAQAMMPRLRVQGINESQKWMSHEAAEQTSTSDSQSMELETQPLNPPPASDSSERPAQNVWFHLANLCFVVAILSDIVLVLKNRTWNTKIYLYAVLALIAITNIYMIITRSVKYSFFIGLCFLVFYEVMCFVMLMDILNQYESLSMIIWLAKSFCKVPFYMELVVNYHKATKLLMYLPLTYLLSINFYPCYLFLHLMIDQPKIVAIVVFIFILTISAIMFGIHVKFCTPDPPIFVIPFSVAFICTEIIVFYMIYRNEQPISTKMFPFLFVISSVCGLAGMALVVVLEISALSLVSINTALTNIWKSFSSLFIIMYLLIHIFGSDLSYIPISFSILVIGLLYCILCNYKSEYAIALIIILFVSYNILVLYKLHVWSSDSSVFLISQATSQLTIVGALLHATGYTKLWKKTSDYNFTETVIMMYYYYNIFRL